jgi:hypothetical protein
MAFRFCSQLFRDSFCLLGQARLRTRPGSLYAQLGKDSDQTSCEQVNGSRDSFEISLPFSLPSLLLVKNSSRDWSSRSSRVPSPSVRPFFLLLLILLDVLLINSLFQVRILLLEVAHMCNLTAHGHACADSGINTTYLESSLRLCDLRDAVRVLMTGYMSGHPRSDMVSLVHIHATATACAIDIDIWLSTVQVHSI